MPDTEANWFSAQLCSSEKYLGSIHKVCFWTNRSILEQMLIGPTLGASEARIYISRLDPP